MEQIQTQGQLSHSLPSNPHYENRRQVPSIPFHTNINVAIHITTVRINILYIRRQIEEQKEQPVTKHKMEQSIPASASGNSRWIMW